MASDNIVGYVQARERSKSGKSWRLKIEGKWYTVSNRANLDGVDQGAYVECRMGGFPGNDGQWVPTIDAIRPAAAPQGSPPKSSGSAPIASSRLASAAWDDSALRFISNVVGCAVTAGHAKDPTDVLAWASAAEQALRNLGQAQAPAGGSQQTPGPAPRGEEDFPFDDSASLNDRDIPPW